MHSKKLKWFLAPFFVFGLALSLAGCGSLSESSSESSANSNEQQASDSSETEEVMEAPQLAIPDSSILAKIERGMTDGRVRELAGSPADARNYQTGKAWIPFYYGPDTSRMEWVYPGEGRVVFSRNRYSGSLKVINVLYNPDQI